MYETEKKYWKNGFQVRGKNFYTITLSIFNLGIMLSGTKIITKIKSFHLLNKK